MASRNLYIVALCCFVAASFAQQYNYVEEEEPQQFARPQHRASPGFSRPSSQAQAAPKPTPVPILKQINRHNDDGSYTYGYEGADGSFKIETKLTTGEVMGKYGYVDDVGKLRVVEYGANKYGFMPAGEGITVAPPTLVDETTDKDGRRVEDYDEPEVRPAPKYRPASKARPQPQPRPQPRPQPQFQEYEEEQRYEQPQPVQNFALVPQRSQVFAPVPQPAPRPAPQPRPVQSFQSSGSPVPPRLSVPGAAPVFAPAPVHEQPRPAPARLPPPPPQRPVYSPQQEARAGRSGSVLDQLAKDYALPQGSGRATHDITFGSY